MDFLNLQLPWDVIRDLSAGKYRKASILIKHYLSSPCFSHLKNRLEYELERISRIKKVFPYTLENAYRKASKYIKGLSYGEFRKLVDLGLCDYIYFNGKMRFEKRFYYNIAFLLKDYKNRAKKSKRREKAKEILDKRIREIISGSKPKDYKIRIRFSISVDGNENKRIWMGFPKTGFQIKDVRMIKASSKRYFLSDNSSPQRTVYFEGKSSIYSVEYEYVVSEWTKSRFFFKDNRENLKNFLSQKPPHIVFTPALVELAKKIVGNEKKAYNKAKKIYDWITTNIRYSYTRPYMFYDNIPEFVVSNMRGDCGFQALLFITLARIVGIPARWQSGWYVNPYSQGPHDWALFYSDEYGWLACDLSFGGARRDDESLRGFYFGNLDGFRLVFNDDFMCDFNPPKKFWRSDPYDNQVGEVETDKGNVYDFRYKLELLDFKEV